MFSSPAPASPGVAEALIAICLMLAAAPHLPGLFNARTVIASPATIAWLWLCIVPLGIGIVAGNLPRDWSRDIVAIFFLGLPILIGKVQKTDIQKLVMAIAAAGTALAARYWLITGANPFFVKPLQNGDGLLYLPLDPAVLFAAIYLPIQLMRISGKRLMSWLLRGICMMGAILCWGALGGMQMRGAMGMGVLSLSLYAFTKIRKPWVPIIMGAVACAVVYLYWDALWHKQQAVGFNARDDDFRVIWQLQSADVFSFLFGRGWGTLYASPAVGNYWVNYSHSAAGFFLLKGGLCGLLVAGTYLFALCRKIKPDPLLFSILPPLFLSFTLYTSYKFLGCGILLLLLHSLYADPDPQSR